MKDKLKTTKKDRVLCECLRAGWLRLFGILPDLYKQNIIMNEAESQVKNCKKTQIVKS